MGMRRDEIVHAMHDSNAENKIIILGLMGLLAQCSPYVPEEIREVIELAFEDSEYVSKIERRLNRIDFVTKDGTRSFDMPPLV